METLTLSKNGLDFDLVLNIITNDHQVGAELLRVLIDGADVSKILKNEFISELCEEAADVCDFTIPVAI